MYWYCFSDRVFRPRPTHTCHPRMSFQDYQRKVFGMSCYFQSGYYVVVWLYVSEHTLHNYNTRSIDYWHKLSKIEAYFIYIILYSRDIELDHTTFVLQLITELMVRLISVAVRTCEVASDCPSFLHESIELMIIA